MKKFSIILLILIFFTGPAWAKKITINRDVNIAAILVSRLQQSSDRVTRAAAEALNNAIYPYPVCVRGGQRRRDTQQDADILAWYSVRALALSALVRTVNDVCEGEDFVQFNEFINWETVNKYRDFGGIRNEEDFVMTENGAQLLGKPKPKTIDEVEAIRA